MKVEETMQNAPEQNSDLCMGACSNSPDAGLSSAMDSGLKDSALPQLLQCHIANMCCPTEERLIRNKLEAMPGVDRLNFNMMRRILSVHHRLDSEDSLLRALDAIGMHATLVQADAKASPSAVEDAPLDTLQKALLGVSGLAASTAEVRAWTGHSDASPLVIALATISILSGGVPTLRKGWIALKTLTLNINFLMSLAVFGAIVLGQWPEAAMVIFLFAVAEMIESMSLNRARNAVHQLLTIAPDTASVLGPDGSVEMRPSDQIEVGALIRVRPGERIALDGVVDDGMSAVNQAPITGESMPVEKQRGDVVFAGTINEHGVLDVRVSANSGDSTLARIVRVIEEAQGRQAPTQRFIDRFARWYTPAVVVAALCIAAVPPLAFGLPAGVWLYKALVMLVIACPCALVISTPVTVVSGLTAAARRGILVKGGEFLEAGGKIAAIALDKTGTLTQGKPVVMTVEVLAAARPDDVLLLAASLNANSTHPLAHAMLEARPKGRMMRQVRGFTVIPGRGVRGEIGGKTYYLGNQRLLDEQGADNAHVSSVLEGIESRGQTGVVLFNAEETLGVIAMADTLRPEAAQAITELAALGVKTVMLTGDNARTAEAIAHAAGIMEARSQLLPEDKLGEIERLQTSFGVVGMLGDGINDAPALAQANVGFAMGAAGSDTAIETADVALMDDNLRKLPQFIRLSRSTRRILVQNIAAALAIKAVFFVMALSGIATLWMAVFADVGASLLVVANGLRLLGMSTERDK
ncbi:cation-translocating P-type ATPase [Herbaspirillum sp. SJZ107]|uniref:heavy metal translocating P-type ATPase n=1 Tax=Herbaspirillum sp. SJZ107 TaxID=2572881 RepID=UPI0011716C5E|nr:heavy metal translocating P-type ATPase [Herbaspirillum sp. SJZ107]TQK01192.1 Cd2+/Zn2+-exporting ATPase [Herbaspirillum sp. SJZ107]